MKDPRSPPIWEEINESYRNYSKNYWTGVKLRNLIYRFKQKFSSSPSHSESQWPF